eukprot:TRINITY_DN81568_c0_g1_i1.p1 TRINITY_DN81568_c0_g1~~TRINITY_DN81568_c0_g1_i1.p1  ORF type:complete len:370 (+),score=124.37 TRINITY_DN81568_c0_g1_i1:146-1255(+)
MPLAKPVTAKSAWDAKENARPNGYAATANKAAVKEPNAAANAVQRNGTLRRAVAAAQGTAPEEARRSPAAARATAGAATKTPAAAKAAAAPQSAARSGTPLRQRPSGTASTVRPAPAVAARTATATVRTTGLRRKQPDPWDQVRAKEAEADREEALIAELEAQVAEAEAEAAAAKVALEEAEEELTSVSGTCLLEYSAKNAQVTTLETELCVERSRLEQLRARNLELTKQNVALDREMTCVAERIAEDQELLRKYCSSQGVLEQEVEDRKQNCQQLREAAAGQGERFASDLRKFQAMKARLQGVVASSTAEISAEAKQLFPVADAIMAQLEELREECQQVAHGDVLPDREEDQDEHDTTMDALMTALTA